MENIFNRNRDPRTAEEFMVAECMQRKTALEQAEKKIAERIKEYIDELYDDASDKLDTYPLSEFLWYPFANWYEVAESVCEEYDEIVYSRDRNAASGDRINPITYDRMLNVMPPKNIPRKTLDRFGCTEGFLVGESHWLGHDGRPLYPAYGRNARGECFYLGLSPAAVGAVASSQRKAAQRRRARDARAKRASERLGKAVGYRVGAGVCKDHPGGKLRNAVQAVVGRDLLIGRPLYVEQSDQVVPQLFMGLYDLDLILKGQLGCSLAV